MLHFLKENQSENHFLQKHFSHYGVELLYSQQVMIYSMTHDKQPINHFASQQETDQTL